MPCNTCAGFHGSVATHDFGCSTLVLQQASLITEFPLTCRIAPLSKCTIKSHGSLHGCAYMLPSHVHASHMFVPEMICWEALSIEEAIASLESSCAPLPIEDYICILKKCRKLRDVSFAKQVYANIHHHGLDHHRILGNYIVPMFIQCGSVGDAQQVFNKLDCRFEQAWTSLIQAYTDSDEPEHSLHLFKEMQQDDVAPNVFTLQALLRACGMVQCIETGQELHTLVTTEGYEGDMFVGNTLVDMYAKCGFLVEAQEVFDELPFRDVVSWSALVLGYSEHGQGEHALRCFDQMWAEGTSLDAITFNCGVKACGSAGALRRGQELHLEIVVEGLEENLFIVTSLVDMYAKCALVFEAEDTFLEVQERGVAVWNALTSGYLANDLCFRVLECLEQMQSEGVLPNAITYVSSLKACASLAAFDRGQALHDEIIKRGLEGSVHMGSALLGMYAQSGLLIDASDLFNKLPTRDVWSWNALIAGFAEHELGEKALSCIKQMRLEGISEIDTTFICGLKVCGSIGALVKGREIHAELLKVGFEADPLVSNTIVDMYAKCGALKEAYEMFNELGVRIVISWNALITGYARQGEIELALELFGKMRKEGAQPSGVTYLCVLLLCSHAGLVEKGCEYFEIMGKECNVVVSIKHHNCMVDLFARAGQLAEARQFIKKMPFQPNYVTWEAMLSGCRKWNNAELGREAFDNLMKFEKKYLGAFISMHNIYVDAQMWQEAKEIDDALKAYAEGLQDSGITLIEMGGVVRAFTVDDMQHVRSRDMDILDRYNENME